MRPPLLLTTLAFLLPGCGLFGGDEGEIEIRTDANFYTASSEESIELTVANRSEDPIFYVCTGQVFLQELNGDAVVNSWMIHGFEECLSPEPIDVDQKEVFDLAFDEKSALGNVEGAAFGESVEYRLTVDLFWDRSFKRKLDAEDSRSNRFRIVRNPVE